MVKKWGRDFYRHTMLCGGSAGTIIALGIALGKSPQYMLDLYNFVGENLVSYGPIYYVSIFMEEAVRRMLEDPMAYKAIEGRFCIGTTAFFAKHRWHISWESNEDLINCLKASYYIPLYCRKTDTVKGIHSIDGAYGFAGCDLPHGDETLFVGIDPHAELTREFTNAEMFYPSQGKQCEEVLISGIRAFHEWDGTMKKKVGHRQPNYSALYVLWFFKWVEYCIYFIPELLYYIMTTILYLCAAVRLSPRLEEN